MNMRLIDEDSYNKLANRACLFYYAIDDVYGFEPIGAPTLNEKGLLYPSINSLLLVKTGLAHTESRTQQLLSLLAVRV